MLVSALRLRCGVAWLWASHSIVCQRSDCLAFLPATSSLDCCLGHATHNNTCVPQQAREQTKNPPPPQRHHPNGRRLPRANYQYPAPSDRQGTRCTPSNPGIEKPHSSSPTGSGPQPHRDALGSQVTPSTGALPGLVAGNRNYARPPALPYIHPTPTTSLCFHTTVHDGVAAAAAVAHPSPDPHQSPTAAIEPGDWYPV